MMDYTKLFDLQGRKAVVVGAGSGIGRAATLAMQQFGADVVAADLSAEGVAETIRLASDGGGGQVRGASVDLREPASVVDLVATSEDADIVVLTAAMHRRKAIADLTEEDVNAVLDLNVRSTFRLMRSYADVMARAGGGSIVTFTSIRAQVHEPGTSIYGASKAAVTSLVKAVATEYGPHGVRVNCIAPSPVETPMTAPVKADPLWYGAYADKTVLGRWAQPVDLIGPILLLVSDAGSFITGSCLPVDGGWFAADGRFDPPLHRGEQKTVP